MARLHVNFYLFNNAEQHKRELAVLQGQLDKALLIIDVQKKVSMLIGLTLATPTQGDI
jgi:hypothetical protein